MRAEEKAEGRRLWAVAVARGRSRRLFFWLQPTAHSLPHLLGACHIRTPGSDRSGVVVPLSYQSSIRRKEIECVVGSAISPAASCARVNQRASSSSSSL